MNLSVIVGDITTLRVDAIVNAANAELLPGGGVCGAIHRAAGPGLARECLLLDGCKTGWAVITSAGLLPSRFVIHAVGPHWIDGAHGEAKALANAYTNSLIVAEKYGCASIAFPCISTGIYGYPARESCQIAVSTVVGFGSRSLAEVIFCCFTEADAALYRAEIAATA